MEWVPDNGRMTAPLPRPVAFRGFCFPPDVISVAVRWYLRFNLSYRDVEELLAERGIEVDHVTIHRWVRRFIPLFINAARDRREPVGRRAGTSTRPMFASGAAGTTCTAPSTSMARSLTFAFRPTAMRRPRGASA
jgi:hypothetical protein